MGRLGLVVSAIVLLLIAGAVFVLRPWETAEFDLAGPEQASPLKIYPDARIGDFERGGANRLAVLVTDPDADWLGLVRGFQSNGVPFIITENPARALRHDVVLAYPAISGRLISAPNLRALAGHVREGGTLLTFNLAGGGLEPLFGIAGQSPSRGRAQVMWTAGKLAGEEGRFNSDRAEAQVGSDRKSVV